MKKLVAILLTMVAFVAIFTEARATTFDDIKARVREYLYEPSSTNSIYSDTMIYEAIAQGEKYLSDALPLSSNVNLNVEGTMAVSIGTSTYSLPSDFRKIIALKYAGIPAIQVRLEEFYSKPSRATLTKDTYFTILDDKIKVWPTPTATTQEISLIYQKKTATIGGSVTLSIKDDFKYMLVLAACRYLLYVDGQGARADSVAKELNGELQAIYSGMQNSNVIEEVKASGSKQ